MMIAGALAEFMQLWKDYYKLEFLLLLSAHQRGHTDMVNTSPGTLSMDSLRLPHTYIAIQIATGC